LHLLRANAGNIKDKHGDDDGFDGATIRRRVKGDKAEVVPQLNDARLVKRILPREFL
jgi:hypothetical protein